MQQVGCIVPDQPLLRPQFSATSSYQCASFPPSIPQQRPSYTDKYQVKYPSTPLPHCALLACCLSEMFVEPRRPGTYMPHLPTSCYSHVCARLLSQTYVSAIVSRHVGIPNIIASTIVTPPVCASDHRPSLRAQHAWVSGRGIAPYNPQGDRHHNQVRRSRAPRLGWRSPSSRHLLPVPWTTVALVLPQLASCLSCPEMHR